MVKGRVQPSEKYISKSMMPYTNAQKYQSIQIKSSTSRHQLVISEMKANQLTGKNSPMRNLRVPTTSQKSKKGTKATKGKNAPQSQKRVEESASSPRKKGIIYEMESEDEHTGSEKDFENKETGESWRDVLEENTQLKDQI